MLTICIPTINRSSELRTLISSIEYQVNELSLQGAVEIVVGNNGETIDPTVFGSSNRVRILNHGKNIGYRKNIIELIHAAKSEFVWLLSDKTTLENGSVGAIVSALSTPGLNYLTFRVDNYYLGEFIAHDYFITEHGPEFYESGASFLNESFRSVIFISVNIFRRKLMTGYIDDNIDRLSNKTYFNSEICFGYIHKYGGVGVIRKILARDNYIKKMYTLDTYFRVNLLDEVDLAIKFAHLRRAKWAGKLYRAAAWNLILEGRNAIVQKLLFNEIQESVHAFGYLSRTVSSRLFRWLSVVFYLVLNNLSMNDGKPTHLRRFLTLLINLDYKKTNAWRANAEEIYRRANRVRESGGINY